MHLTDVKIRNTKPEGRPVKLRDGDGLYLLVNPNGSRYWRFRYQVDGREKMISLGTYPEVSLVLARSRREEARRVVAGGGDPSVQRQTERATLANTFEAIAREWLGLQAHELDPRTHRKKRERLEKFAFPYFGSHPITKVTAQDLLSALRRIEARGKHETTHRVRAECGRIFRYAVATGRAERDPTTDLRGALVAVSTRNRPAIVDPNRIGEVLRAIDGYRGHLATEFALRLLPLTFVRPGELRNAEWSEFDLEAAEWRIPARRMKMRELHVVPLSTQAVTLLRDLRLVTGSGSLVFPSITAADRPISDNTINAALRRLGFTGDEIVAHGFRATASTCLNEQGWHPDLIELQLAHSERDEVRGAYNRAQRLPERRKMMQSWADYLDALRTRRPESASSAVGSSLPGTSDAVLSPSPAEALTPRTTFISEGTPRATGRLPIGSFGAKTPETPQAKLAKPAQH